MNSQNGDPNLQSPGSYVSFLLANSAQELSQLIQNYLLLGQFEAARCSIAQLFEIDPNQATNLVYNVLQLQPAVYVASTLYAA